MLEAGTAIPFFTNLAALVGVAVVRELSDQEREEAELQQIRQQSSPYQAKHIGRSIRQIMARTGLGQTQSAMEVAQAWAQAAGPQLASVSRPGTLSRGALVVYVKDSSAMQELQLCQRQMLAELQRVLPQAGIRSIRCRLG